MVSCGLDRWIQSGQTHLPLPGPVSPATIFVLMSFEKSLRTLGERCASSAQTLITLVSLHLSALPTSLSSQTAPPIIIKVHTHRTAEPHPGSLEACRKDKGYIFCGSRTPQVMKWGLKVLRQYAQSQVWWLTLVNSSTQEAEAEGLLTCSRPAM